LNDDDKETRGLITELKTHQPKAFHARIDATASKISLCQSKEITAYDH
jgi:hypothetical protein